MRCTTSLLLVGLLASASGSSETIDWRNDLNAARAFAQKSGRPMLIVFR